MVKTMYTDNCSDLFLLGRDFVVQTETVQAVYFWKNADIVILHRETTRKR